MAVVTSDFEQGGDFDIRFTKNFTAKAPVPATEVLSGLSLHYSPASLSNSLQEREYGLPNFPSEVTDLILTLQEKAHNLELVNKTNTECLEMYLESRPINYRHIIAISSNTISNNSILWLDSSSSPNENSRNQVCSRDRDFDLPCYSWSAADFAVSSLESYAECKDILWEWNSYSVSRCLVERAKDPCLLRYNSSVLIVVLIAIVIKLVAMSATMFYYRKPAPATVGDALASFLETPDCTTYQMCLTRKDEFNSNIWTSGPKEYATINTEIQRSAGASQLQWANATAM